MRLYGKVTEDCSRPLATWSSVIRAAAFCAQGYCEVDLAASHGSCTLEYAREHGLGHEMLSKAFKDLDAIADFRRSLPGLTVKQVKLATILVLYFAGDTRLAEVVGNGPIPADLLALREETRAIRSHVWSGSVAPTSWQKIVNMHNYRKPDANDQTTMVTVMINIKERARLDVVEAHVKSLGCSVKGYLCDSIITGIIALDCSAFPFPVTTKPFAADQHDFEKVYKDKTGVDFDWDPLTPHERERMEAKMASLKWLQCAKKTGCFKHPPLILFARGVEPHIDSYKVTSTERMTFKVSDRLYKLSKELTADDVLRGLERVYTSKRSVEMLVDGQIRHRMVPGQSPSFFHGPFLNSVRELMAKLDPLSFEEGNQHCINFSGPMCFDPSTVRPEFDMQSDASIVAALYSCVREATKADMFARCTGDRSRSTRT